METLFTPEVVQQFLEVLKTAADGSVTVLVVYFLLPLMMLIVSSLAWFFGVYFIIKNVCGVVKDVFNRPKFTRLDVSGHFIENGGGPKAFVELINSIKVSTGSYVHRGDVEWLRVAVCNQKILDKKNEGTVHNPHKLS